MFGGSNQIIFLKLAIFGLGDELSETANTRGDLVRCRDKTVGPGRICAVLGITTLTRFLFGILGGGNEASGGIGDGVDVVGHVLK